MLVGQVIDKFLGLTESWIYSQIKGLEKLNIKSQVFCHKIVNPDTYSFKPIHSYKDLSNFRINLYRLFGLFKAKDAALLYWDEIVKKEKPDIIHSHFGFTAAKGIDLAIKNNLPHIVTFYGADVFRDPYGKSPAQKFYQSKLPLIFQRSNKILFTSRFLKDKLVRLGAPEEKLQLWHLGLDLDLFNRLSKRKSNKFKIISCGRFKKWKGQKYLILALPEVLKKDKNIKVVFIGQGEELDNCKKLVDQLRISQYVEFKERIVKYLDVIKEMASSHLIVHSSFTAKNRVCDALGMVLVEAGACEVPTVASRSGGIPEAVLDKKTGFLVKPKNPKQIAEKIILLMENENLRKKMGQEAKKYIQKEFDLERQVKKLEKIYKEALSLGPLK